jgi:hypothetical protein
LLQAIGYGPGSDIGATLIDADPPPLLSLLLLLLAPPQPANVTAIASSPTRAAPHRLR